MRIMFSRIFVTMIVGVVLGLMVDWLFGEPWMVVTIAVCTVLGLASANRGALPEIRRMREEAGREREEFLRARGRR